MVRPIRLKDAEAVQAIGNKGHRAKTKAAEVATCEIGEKFVPKAANMTQNRFPRSGVD